MNNLKQQLGSNLTIYGTMVSEFHTPNIAVVLKTCGFDYLIVDCEHGYFDYSMVANMAAVARGNHIPLLVRIPEVKRECMVKYLDMGVDGLLIPMANSAEVIRRAVEYAKYAPLGQRGVSTTRAHTGYKVDDLQVYMAEANRKTIVLAQIESREGLKRLDEIAAVEGLDGLIVGPNDLAQDLGIAGSLSHPLMLAAIDEVAQACRTRGIASGIIASNLDLLKHCESLGMQLLGWSSEIGMLMKGAQDGLGKLKASKTNV